MKIANKYLGLILGVLVLVLLYTIQIYLPANDNGLEQTFIIQKGDSVSKIAANLKKVDLIRNDFLFKIYVELEGARANLKSGRYILSPTMSLSRIAQKIIKGDTNDLSITIIEGWDKYDIANYLENQNLFSRNDFLYSINDPNIESLQNLSVLQDKPITASLEGYLFPDTYKIGNDFGAQTIINKAISNLDKKIDNQTRQDIIKQHKTIFEIITMASMIEKEVKTKADKEIVSGILWKRLRAGMPLQVDATINYFTKKQTTDITHDDLSTDSPYNTYLHVGLPIGPISNPGLDSILAAAYPKESKYWYYLSTPDGTTIFSKTLSEHNIARAKYLK